MNATIMNKIEEVLRGGFVLVEEVKALSIFFPILSKKSSFFHKTGLVFKTKQP
mgnify:CR=1 FL=1